jgi:DNA topoisomerase-1
MSVGFTAEMEDQLDRVAAGETDWVPIVRAFYTPFEARLAAAEKEMPKVALPEEEVGRDCPECGGPLAVKWGRYGRFIGCGNYPACRHTEPFLEKVGAACPQCGGDLVRRRTRKGRPFYGCSNYPDCDFTSWKRPLSTPCPACSGLLVVASKRQARCLACEETVELDDLPQDD